MLMFIGFLVILGFSYYVTTPDERVRILRQVRVAIDQAYEVAQGGPPHKPFPTALRDRTPDVRVTPALLLLNAAIFVFMLLVGGSVGDTQATVGWGTNAGPRTTNGEWHRLIASLFIHSGVLHLLINLSALAAVGFITERLVGPVAFAAVYLGAGLFGSLVSLSVNPLGVSFGASAAIMGIYGLLLASSIVNIFVETDVRIPKAILKKLAPVGGVFVLYTAVTASVPGAAELTGLAVGFLGGLFMTFGIGDQAPKTRRVTAATAGILVLAIGYAVPLSGIEDATAEIKSVVTMEDRTVSAYGAELDRYRKRKSSAEALTALIERTIIPEVQGAAERVKVLDRVPAEQRLHVERVAAYLRLREESWRLRAEGLRQMGSVTSRTPNSHESTLRKAEITERASLDALSGVRHLIQ